MSNRVNASEESIFVPYVDRCSNMTLDQQKVSFSRRLERDRTKNFLSKSLLAKELSVIPVSISNSCSGTVKLTI